METGKGQFAEPPRALKRLPGADSGPTRKDCYDRARGPNPAAKLPVQKSCVVMILSRIA